MICISDNQINEFCNLEVNKKYKIINENMNEIDMHVFEVVMHYCKILEINKNPEIYYELINKDITIDIDLEDEKESLLTIITFPDLLVQPIIQTEISQDSYKYKEIPNENNLYIFIPQKNTYVSLHPSKYYGILASNDICKYLKITLWESELEIPIERQIGFKNKYEIIKPNEFNLEKKLIKNDIFENILYDISNEDSQKLLYNIIDETKLTNNSILKILFSVNNNYDLNYMENHYGDIANDIINILTGELPENNRFYTDKIIRKIYSLDVCYWIINECEKKKWSNSDNKNYYEIIEAETIPHIFNFLIYSSNLWMLHLKKIFNIYNKNIKINISDIFISRNLQYPITKNIKNENSHLVCIVKINDTLDHNGGEIIVNNNKYNLMQGDMLIYHSLKNRQDVNIINGVIYYLVFYIEIGF
jgi:hypothetical protein